MVGMTTATTTATDHWFANEHPDRPGFLVRIPSKGRYLAYHGPRGGQKVTTRGRAVVFLTREDAERYATAGNLRYRNEPAVVVTTDERPFPAAAIPRPATEDADAALARIRARRANR